MDIKKFFDKVVGLSPRDDPGRCMGTCSELIEQRLQFSIKIFEVAVIEMQQQLGPSANAGEVTQRAAALTEMAALHWDTLILASLNDHKELSTLMTALEVKKHSNPKMS